MRVCFLLLLFILLMGCSKQPLPEGNPDFVGLWSGNIGNCEQWLNIEENGVVRFSSYGISQDCDKNHTAKGKVNDELLKAGSMKFKIIKAPHHLGDTIANPNYYITHIDSVGVNWKMTLEYKIDGGSFSGIASKHTVDFYTLK